MGKDSHHRGARGLFDDMDDASPNEAHEMHNVEKMKRRQREQMNKEAKRAQRLAMGKPAESKLSYLFTRAFSKNDKKDDDVDEFEPSANEKENFPPRVAVATGAKAMVMAGETAKYHRNREWDTGAVESPWLKECGMIRVKSNNPGGCHIVAKPFILKDT